MSTKTTNYNLVKPEENDYYDIGVPNGNMDLIDTELKSRADALSAHASNTVFHTTQADKNTLAAAVQSATLGGAAVTKSGTTLQLPAYPTSLPANGGSADTAKKLYTTSHPNDHSLRLNWTGSDFLAKVVCETDNSDRSIFVNRCSAADYATYSTHWVASSAAAVRNITMSTAAPSGGQDGDVWHVYA